MHFIDEWDRTRAGFALTRIDAKEVTASEAWHAAHPELVTKIFERSSSPTGVPDSGFGMLKSRRAKKLGLAPKVVVRAAPKSTGRDRILKVGEPP